MHYWFGDRGILKIWTKIQLSLVLIIGTLLFSSVPFLAYVDENIKLVVPNFEKTISILEVHKEILIQEQERALIEQEEQRKEEEYLNKINSVRNSAMKYLGVPYVWGGTTPTGFDCSGLVQYVFAECGISISRTTYTQIKEGEPISLDSLTLGDIVFWGDYHVGIYIGDGQYIHAPHSGDVVKISSMDYWCPTSARRLIFRE